MAALRVALGACLACLGGAALAAQTPPPATTSSANPTQLSRANGAIYVRILVKFRDGTPAGSAPVELHQLGGVLLATGLTTSNGEYKFRTKAAGPYEVHISTGGINKIYEMAEGEETQPIEITLNADSTTAPADGPDSTVSSNDLAAPQKAREKLAAAGQEIAGLNFKKARKLVDETIALAPQWGRPYFVRGLLDMDDHDYAHARDDLNTAVADNPSNSAALSALGRLYAATGQYDAAEAALHRALALPPVLWQTYSALAHVDIARGKFDEGEDMARSALAAKPAAPFEAHLLVAEAAMGLHDWQTAAEQMRTYLGQNSGDAPLTLRVKIDLNAVEARLRQADAASAAAAAQPAQTDAPPDAPPGALPDASPAPTAPAAAGPDAPAATPPTVQLPPSPPPPPLEPAPTTELAPLRPWPVSDPPVATCGNCARGVLPAGTLVIRRWVNEINLQVTVEDRGHQVVGGLPASDFRVFDQGVPQQLLSFAQQDAPISLGILIDASGSMAPMRTRINQAALNFIGATNPGDEVFVADFADRFTLATPFTNDVAALRQGLRKTTSSGGTAMYDAVLSALDYLNANATRPKRVLLVVTDGQDDESRHTLDQMLNLLHDPDAPLVYCIGLTDELSDMSPEGHHALTALAGASGGMVYFPREIGDVDRITRSLANAIRAQYALAFKSSQGGGGFHSLRVDIHDAHLGSLVAVTRDGYTAEGNR